MSRLDLLISFMDQLDERSSALLQSSKKTSSLAHLVVRLNTSIIDADSTINTLNNSIALNNSFIHKIDQLYQRTFLLESSFHANDRITNENILSNLYSEFEHISTHLDASHFDHNPTSPSLPADIDISLDSFDSDIATKTVGGKLLKSLSVSDIQLKPIRCREKRMYKKKSRYRISPVYNINPLSGGGLLDIPSGIEEEITQPSSSSLFTDTSHDADDEAKEDKSELTLATSPDASFTPFSFSSRLRSNSVPEITFTHSGLNIFNTEGIAQASNILGDYAKNETEDSMRLNRLRHFISIHHGLNKELNKHDEIDLKPNIGSDVTKTPVFTPVDLNCDDPNDMDILNIDACSDFSYYSPEKTEDVEDDFEKYLRKSRLDFQSVLPNLIQRSTSHESVFSQIQPIEIPKWTFHNPIDNTASTHVTAPTIQVSDYIHSYKGESTSLKGQMSTNLLSKMMKETEPQPITISAPTTLNEKTPEYPLTPSKSFSIFNFSASPFSAPSFSASSFPDTSGLSKSFSESIMNLVQKTPEKKSKPKIEAKKLKKQPSFNKVRPTKPILIENLSQQQRLPRKPASIPLTHERDDGTHSKLTIGPNKTKIFKHGELSLFRKPLLSKVSHNSLQEALSFKIM